VKRLSRRDVLKGAATAAGTLMAGLPKAWAGGVYATDAPETANVRFGMIALTDCAPIVIAHELGFFKQFGISATGYFRYVASRFRRTRCT
jgi:nitrate/nitrite transport system substrate-binding protein